MKLAWIVAAALTLAGPAAAQPTADAARLAVAQRIAVRLLPDGIFAKMMDGTLAPMMDGMQGQMLNTSVAEFVRAAGIADKVAPPAATTLRDIALIVDPVFERRSQITTRIMMGEVTRLLSTQEPNLRAGFAEAYARRFSQRELDDIDAFFATPSGTAFAGASTTIGSDPAIIARMQAIMPEMTKLLPAVLQKAMAATADLPKPRELKNLSAAERQKLAALLGVAPEELQ